ncbi:hypothetical protein PG994_005559 [Apiospora phragmitis]|uniref:Cell wall cysteine-rich protein n=1 Tax=Apiospora phragmitis TaxID=2905665 RepID=A0ABR1VGD2_9PEZI
MSWKNLLLSICVSSTYADSLPLSGRDAINLDASLITRQPAKRISLDDIRPITDSNGHLRCCPLGTINDGVGCVFPQSSVCPENSRLVGNLCVLSTPPKCPENLVFKGQACVGSLPPDCGAGFKFNGRLCETETDPVCPRGTLFDGENCRSDTPVICPPGHKLEDRLCVSTSPPGCPNGLILQGESCVGSLPPSCPRGTRLAGGSCNAGPPSCTRGFDFKDGKCTSTQPPGCPRGSRFDGSICTSEEPPHCGAGRFDGKICVSDGKPSVQEGTNSKEDHVFSTTYQPVAEAENSWNGECVFPGPPGCPRGSTFDGSRCIVERGPQCPRGSIFNGHGCTSEDPPSCPRGTTYIGGACVSKSPANCPTGSTLIGDVCVYPTPPKCPDCPRGSVFDGKNCIANDRPTCPRGSSFDGKGCVVPQQPVCDRGLTFIGNECVSDSPPDCPRNTYYDGSACVTKGGPECAKDWSLMAKPVSLPMALPVLEARSTTAPSASATPSQTAEKTWILTAKDQPSKPPCGQGLVLDPKGDCVSAKQPQCDKGTLFDGVKCVIGKSSTDCYSLNVCPPIGMGTVTSQLLASRSAGGRGGDGEDAATDSPSQEDSNTDDVVSSARSYPRASTDEEVGLGSPADAELGDIEMPEADIHVQGDGSIIHNDL